MEKCKEGRIRAVPQQHLQVISAWLLARRCLCSYLSPVASLPEGLKATLELHGSFEVLQPHLNQTQQHCADFLEYLLHISLSTKGEPALNPADISTSVRVTAISAMTLREPT